MSIKGLVVIVGRPHVGKSTLAQYLSKRGLEVTTDKARIKDASVVLLMVDASQIIDESDVVLAAEISHLKKHKILVLNKIDIVQDEDLGAHLEVASHLGDFSNILPISALSEKDIGKLVEMINKETM